MILREKKPHPEEGQKGSSGTLLEQSFGEGLMYGGRDNRRVVLSECGEPVEK